MTENTELPICPTCGREATGDLSARLIRESLTFPEHDLLFPSNPLSYYVSSAFCSCGKFQYDAESESALLQEYAKVLQEFREHVIKSFE